MRYTCKQPLVSIIVPVYKVEKYIGICIESIQAQICTDWELILVDDGSPDKSGLICDNYASKDSRIIVLHKINKGVSAARNDALRVATGKYVCFVDSDDYVLPRYLSDMVEYESDVVVTGYINRYDPQIRKDHCRPIAGDRFYSESNKNIINGIVDLEIDTRWLGPAAKLYLRSIIIEHNIQFDEVLDYGEDHLFNMEFGRYIKSIAFLNRHNYIYMHREIPSLSNRLIPSKIHFNYIVQLYTMRIGYLNNICNDEKYREYNEYINSELTTYYWQTIYSLFKEQQHSNKTRCKIISSILNTLPQTVLYDRQYKLAIVYEYLRCIYRILPTYVSTIIADKSLRFK